MGRFDFEYPAPKLSEYQYEKTTLVEALGDTVIWFGHLDDQLATAISFLLARGDDVGRIVTAELSFRAKANLFSALFRHARPASSELDTLHDLYAACLQIEDKRQNRCLGLLENPR